MFLQQGAQTSLHCAVDESVEQISGEYFADCQVTKSSEDSKNPKLALDLWEKSAEILQMEEFEIVI